MVHKYVKYVSEPWFSLIAVGQKTVEGRLHRNDWYTMEEGDLIQWNNSDLKLQRSVQTVIVKKETYNTVEQYLEHQGLLSTVPSVVQIQDAVSIYRSFWTTEDEHRYGVVALTLRLCSL